MNGLTSAELKPSVVMATVHLICKRFREPEFSRFIYENLEGFDYDTYQRGDDYFDRVYNTLRDLQRDRSPATVIQVVRTVLNEAAGRPLLADLVGILEAELPKEEVLPPVIIGAVVAAGGATHRRDRPDQAALAALQQSQRAPDSNGWNETQAEPGTAAVRTGPVLPTPRTNRQLAEPIILRCELPKGQRLEQLNVRRGQVEFVTAKLGEDDEFDDRPIELRELISEKKIKDHFLEFPRVMDNINGWLEPERDLLFLGLPYCGKTTLLRFLFFALRAAGIDPSWEGEAPAGPAFRSGSPGGSPSRGERRLFARERYKLPQLPQAKELIPFYLWPHKEFFFETKEAEAAIIDLEKLLEKLLSKSDWLEPKPRAVLFIDNVHEPQIFELAKQLLRKQPRRWLVWGAARTGELDALLKDRREKNPWKEVEEAEVVSDVCGLAGGDEIKVLVRERLRQVLKDHQEEDQEEAIREALTKRGDVSVRVLMSMARIVYELVLSVGTKSYAEAIAKVPTDAEQILAHLMPNDILGMSALVIADFLRKPPRDLFEHVLSEVANAEFGDSKLSAVVLKGLQATFTVDKDPKQPRRVSIYVPVRETIQKPGNRTKTLKAQIWSAVQLFLQKAATSGQAEESKDLSDAWDEIRQLAQEEKQPRVRVDAARMAQRFAPESEKHAAWYYLAEALYDKENPEWEEALHCSLEALKCSGVRDDTVQKALILCQTGMCYSRQPKADWKQAKHCYRDAAKIFRKTNQAEQRADALVALAECLWYDRPQPHWTRAVILCDGALKLVPSGEQPPGRSIRARAFRRLAECFRFPPEPRWAEAVARYKDALELLTAPEDAAERLWTLYDLGESLRQQPEKDWDGAVTYLEQALKSLPAGQQQAERALILGRLADGLRNRPSSDWARAIECYREAVKVYRALGRRTDLAGAARIGRCLARATAGGSVGGRGLLPGGRRTVRRPRTAKGMGGEPLSIGRVSDRAT